MSNPRTTTRNDNTWTVKRTSHSRACMPYLLILNGAGLVQYRIDKVTNGQAATALFCVYECDGSGAYHGTALIQTKLEAKGIAQARSMATDLAHGLPVTCELYMGRDLPLFSYTFTPSR